MAQYYRVFAAPQQSDYQNWLAQQSSDASYGSQPSYDQWVAAGGRGKLLRNSSSKHKARAFAAKNPGSIFDFQADKRGGIGGALGGMASNIGSGLSQLVQNPGFLEAALVAGGGLGLASMYGPGAAGAGAGIGASAAPGEALYSTVAEPGLFGSGAAASTPAMTTYAGPAGTAVGGTTAPATLGAASAGAGMGGGALIGNATTSPVSSSITNADLGATPIDMAGPSQGSIANVSPVGSGPMDPSMMDPYAGGDFSGAAYAGAPVGGAGATMKSILSSPSTYQLGGSLYQMYQANQAKDAYEQMLNEMNSDQYDYRQNDDLVQEYLRDPMGLLKKHPGYQASVDFLTKQGQRQMAAKGYSGSGNIGYYLADTLGKNAADWHSRLWDPIAQSAGLSNYPNKAALGSVGVNAQSEIDRAKRSATHEIFNAGRQHLPEIFKNWTTE